MAEEALFQRPMPPGFLFDTEHDIFVPAPELNTWAYRMLVESCAPFYNPEHDHLIGADVGMLWTNHEIVIRGAPRSAVAMMPQGQGSKLDRSMRGFMWRMFFRSEPTFVIIFNASDAAGASDRGFLRLCDHELTHCGEKKNRYECPDYKADGSPKFTMRAHDRECFDSEIGRWGTRSVFGDETEMVVRAATRPEYSDIDIAEACGTCKLR